MWLLEKMPRGLFLNLISPDVGTRRVLMILIKVDLPAPFLPRRP